MSFAEITDKTSILKAIEEFDVLGRKDFLQKYGFSTARSYFLLYNGGRYDSKAIMGAAHGYQYPDLGALKSVDFSGGDATVVKKLRKLGFEVTRSGYEKRGIRTWAFCANPKHYVISDAVRHLDGDHWSIGRSDVRKGDRAIVWQTQDKHKNRGIVAYAEVIGDPVQSADDTNQYWLDVKKSSEKVARVPVIYHVPKNFPLWVGETKVGEFLKTLSVAKAQGGTVFRVSEEQWSKLTSLASFDAALVEQIQAQELIRYRSKPSAGQGFGLNAKERRAVEHYAMDIASVYLKKYWKSVEDVSGNSNFDLLCRKGNEELRVEVKGTTTDGQQIILTRNEVAESMEPGYALFIAARVKVVVA